MASARERLSGGESSEDILAAREIRLNSFYLHGRSAPGSPGASVNIAGSITSAELELTIEGASTLTVTVEDPDRHLLNSEVLTRWTWGETGFRDGEGWVRKGRAVDAYLPAENPKNRLPFRLVKVSLAGTEVTLTFEDRIVALLRQHKGARKLSRAKGTRAMFIKMLADEVKAYGGVPVFIPELRKRQPIAKAEDAESGREKRENARPGIADDADLTVKGKKATREQIRNMERVLDVADSLNASPKAAKALVLACIVESLFRNLPGGHADSRGILQVRDSTARDMGINNRDVEQCAHAFLTKGFWGRGGAIEIARRSPSQSAGWVAQQAQGSAYPDRYDQYSDEADAILRAYKPGGGRRNGETYTKQYVFERGKDEDSWTAMGRLAEEVAWRRFVRKGRLWYVSEEYLFNQRAAMTIDLDHPAVEDVQLELDPMARHPIAEVTLSARVGAWQALPGMVVVLKDAGPASGRWLVSSVRRDLFDSLAEVRLTKPIDPKPEPRSQTVQRQRSDEIGYGRYSGRGDSVYAERALVAAAKLHAMKLPYRWGGGHDPTSFRHPKGPPPGLDCSGAVCWVLREAGMFNHDVAWVSGKLASDWGEPGRGKYMTVWANKGHVFIEFKLPGKRWKRFDTTPYGDGPRGARLRRTDRPKSGFTPRHWPGS